MNELKSNFGIINSSLLFLAAGIITCLSLFVIYKHETGKINRNSYTTDAYLSKVEYMANDPSFISKYNDDDVFFFSGALSGDGGDKNKTKIKLSPTRSVTIEVLGLDKEFNGELTAFLRPIRTFCLNIDKEKPCNEIVSKVEVKNLHAYKSIFNTDDLKKFIDDGIYGYRNNNKHLKSITYSTDRFVNADGLYFLDKEKTICLNLSDGNNPLNSPGSERKFKIPYLHKEEIYSKNNLERCSFKASIEAV